MVNIFAIQEFFCKYLYFLNLATKTSRVVFLVVNYNKNCPNCPDFNSAEFAANSWPTVDLRLNNEPSSNFWPSETSTLPSPPARGAPHPPCSSFRFRFIFILHRPDGTCKHRSALNVMNHHQVWLKIYLIFENSRVMIKYMMVDWWEGGITYGRL